MTSSGETGLERALSQARIVGQATGVLMAAYDVSYDDALHRLVEAARAQGATTRELAEHVVMTADLVVVRDVRRQQ